MPSTTFLNLPPEKRDTFLAAAKAEFSRVPYPEASINQIIRTAGIPRGSFYMYFKDKEELFRHLIAEYAQGLERLALQALVEQNGNLLAAFLSVFDFIQRTVRDPVCRTDYDTVLRMAALNSTMLVNTLIKESSPDVSGALLAHIDRSLLSLQGDEDLTAILSILQSVSAPAIRDAVLATDPAAARRRYVNTLDILARGILR